MERAVAPKCGVDATRTGDRPSASEDPSVTRVAGATVDRRRGRGPQLCVVGLLVMFTMAIGVVPVAAKDGDGGLTQAERVVRAVSKHIGARYVWGSTGPKAFDCSGLVFRSFKQAKLVKRIGGFNTAHGYYQRFKKLGRVTKNPKVGDIVVWNKGGHVGIYVGGGKAVSALLSGVKKHKVRSLNIPFTAYLRVDLERAQDDPSPILTDEDADIRTARQRLPLRRQPSSGSRRLRSVGKGAKMAVIRTRTRDDGKRWLKVQLGNGDKGWVNQRLATDPDPS